ncbi:hypothetical protein EMCRGX_G001885 [Ephydatia muelleri]
MPIAPQVILLLAILVGAQCKRLAPLHAADSPDAIEGEYIVVLHSYLAKQQVNAHIAKVSERALLEQQAVSEKWEDDTDYMQDGPTEAPGDVVPEYRSKQTRYGITSTYAIGMSKAYSARLSDSLRDSIRSMKEVKYIERNQEVTAAACSTQKNADWGLVRTTIRDRSNISPDYVYELDNSGEGVNIYIIDSGISIGNAEFENRASWGTDFVESNNSPMSDPNGHGTRVAGLAMSKTFGIAKKASAIAVRVLSATGTGTSANIIRGIQWATSQHSTGKKSIINLSLSCPKSQAVNDAVQAATDKGVYVVASAGNEKKDACTRSPASAPSSITVMASDSDDSFAWFSNYGSCAHIIAPGVNVKTVGNVFDSGTSFSSPIVAGIIAKHIGPLSADQIPTPADMKKYLISTSSTQKITNIPSNTTPNNLVYYPCSA